MDAKVRKDEAELAGWLVWPETARTRRCTATKLAAAAVKSRGGKKGKRRRLCGLYSSELTSGLWTRARRGLQAERELADGATARYGRRGQHDDGEA